MKKNIIFIFIIFFLLLPEETISQNNRDIDKYGFIQLKTDSMNVPFYVDGIFVGKSPIIKPIPVLPGFHLVSYLPPELTKKYIEEDLSDAYKKVYVSPKDTLEVFLFYEHYIVETKTLDRQYFVKRVTAISLIMMAVFLIFQIS